MSQHILLVDDDVLDPTAHTVTAGGKLLGLPPRELELFHALALEAGRAVPATVRRAGYRLEAQEGRC